MTSDPIEFRENQASADPICSHLLACSASFIPPLAGRVNIPDYAEKIFQRAETQEAWSGSVLVGLVAAYMDGGTAGVGFVTNVSVLPAFMGRGLASHLMTCCIEQGRARRLTQITLEVGAANTAALAFYDRYGFVESGRRDDVVLMTFPCSRAR